LYETETHAETKSKTDRERKFKITTVTNSYT